MEPRRRLDPRPGGARRPTRSCWPHRPARPPGCSPRSRRLRRWPSRGSSTPRWPSSRSPFRTTDFPEVMGSGFLVPPVDGRAGEGLDVLLRQVGLGPRGRREVRRLGARPPLLAGSPPRGADPPARRRRAGRPGAGRPHRRDRSLDRPIDSHVQRWGGALPQYAVGHLDRVATIRREIERLPGVAVCGSAYDGVGIPACIASAHLAAAKVARRPCHNGSMTSADEGTRAQRHDPLHDVVGLPAARRVRRGRIPSRGGRDRSTSCSPSSRPRTSWCGASTSSAGCAPTPT